MTPNPDNVGTVEACQRLTVAGIALETDAIYLKFPVSGWRLLSAADARELYPIHWERVLAPCFTEIWRELPEELEVYGRLCTLQAIKIRQHTGVVVTSVQYVFDNESFGELVQHFNADVNPTDALIDLLIWVKQRKEIIWKL